MAAPTDPFLASFGASMDFLVNETTEIKEILFRFHYPKSKPIEEVLSRILSRSASQADWPISGTVLSVNDAPVNFSGFDTPYLLDPEELKLIPEDTYVVDVKWQILAKKDANMESVLNALRLGDLGDGQMVLDNLITYEVKEGSCPAPVSKIVDITIVS